MTATEDRFAAYRATRDAVETAVLPLATSLDGHRFTLQISVHRLELQVGGYVVLESESGVRLGQVLSLELVRESTADDGREVVFRAVRGEGTILEGDGASFHDARMRLATPDEVRAWAQRSAPRRARLAVGELTYAAGVPHELDAGGFDRHTFLCGQSGSGKTYALGVVLERLLAETELRMVVLDPNSDFVRLDRVREGADDARAARHREVAGGIEVHTARPADGQERLRVRFGDLQRETQAALLRLDPIADRDEYAELAALLVEERPPSLEALMSSDRPGAQRLGSRIRNLGLWELGVWAREDAGSLLDALRPGGPRCVVVDLGSLPTQEEQSLVATSVLDTLWAGRVAREPVLIVIDEAHNVCPGEPADALTALATELTVRIAAEGRKFGLYLLVATQRPQKVPENVISQADNLILMRLNSAADAAFAQTVFSFVPATLIERASGFGLGEAVVAGKLSSHAALLRFGARVAEEGGADVPATWAAPRR